MAESTQSRMRLVGCVVTYQVAPRVCAPRMVMSTYRLQEPSAQLAPVPGSLVHECELALYIKETTEMTLLRNLARGEVCLHPKDVDAGRVNGIAQLHRDTATTARRSWRSKGHDVEELTC